MTIGKMAALIAIVPGILTIHYAQAQTAAPHVKFEVASVKVTQSPGELLRAGKGFPSRGPVFSGTRVEIGNISLKDMVALAYGEDIRKITAPAWTADAYFSLQAVMPDGATKEQFPEMLRALLEERFHLAAHRETRDQTAYAMTIAKGGHKMKPADEVNRAGCDNWRDDAQFAGGKTCNAVLDPNGERITVTIRTDSKYGPSRSESTKGRMDMEFYAITMPQLAEYLTGVLGAGPRTSAAGSTYTQVIDRTGLEGKWRVTVERVFTDVALSAPGGPTQPIPITPGLIADEVAAGFTKMGLKLDKTTAPGEVVIVDKADQIPTEN